MDFSRPEAAVRTRASFMRAALVACRSRATEVASGGALRCNRPGYVRCRAAIFSRFLINYVSRERTGPTLRSCSSVVLTFPCCASHRAAPSRASGAAPAARSPPRWGRRRSLPGLPSRPGWHPALLSRLRRLFLLMWWREVKSALCVSERPLSGSVGRKTRLA